MDSPEVMGQSATVYVPTIRVEAKVNPVSIRIRHHGWITWADIAIEHEAIAVAARKSNPIDEIKPCLVCMTAVAFALDAFYEAAKQLGLQPPATGRKKGDRGRQVGELLKRGASPGKIGSTWPKRIGALFDTRDDAVHFGEEEADPVFHPALNSNVAPEVYEWRLEAATDAVDLMLEVFGAWVDNPSRATASWGSRYGDSVRSLIDKRLAT